MIFSLLKLTNTLARDCIPYLQHFRLQYHSRAYRTLKIASTDNIFPSEDPIYGKTDMCNDFILQPNVHQWEICK